MDLCISNREQLLNEYLIPLSKISDNAVFKVEPGKIVTTIATSDNTIISNACYNDDKINVTKTLNIPDLKKLVRVLACIGDTELKFNIANNYIGYNSNDTRFKIHLYDDGIISLPRLNFEKLNTIKFDGKFTLKSVAIANLIKGSTITTDSNKIYISTTSNTVRGDLTDMNRSNVDSYGMMLADDYTGTAIATPIPLNFEVFRIISSMRFKTLDVQLNSSMNILVFDVTFNSSNMKFVVSALMN
jgi:hypothetical protein